MRHNLLATRWTCCSYNIIMTNSVVLWKIQKFDWLISETNGHSCLHNIALCNETGILGSEAPQWQWSWTRENKCIYLHLHLKWPPSTYWWLCHSLKSLKDKNIPLFDPAVKYTLNTSHTSSPDLLVQWFKIVCRSTDMCTKEGKPMYSKSVWKPGDYLK